MAATRSDERQRKCCRDNVRIWSSGPAKKSGGLVKNRHRWSAGRCACWKRHAGAFQEVPRLRRSAEPALPSLMFEGEGNEGGAPRLTFPGPMNHACINDAT